MIDPVLVYGPTAEQVARALLSSGGYLVSETMKPEDFFRWKSGIEAPVYTDCRVIQSHPGPFATIVEALVSSVQNNFAAAEAVIGMAEAGIVWSAPVALSLGLPHAFVRKQRKDHGRGRLVEGHLAEGVKVVLVDDLMAGGGTAEQAIEILETEVGAETVGIQTIVNWDFTAMRVRFRRLGIPYRTLVSFPQILDAAVLAGKLTKAAGIELKSFYLNPESHVWRLEMLSRGIDQPDHILMGI